MTIEGNVSSYEIPDEVAKDMPLSVREAGFRGRMAEEGIVIGDDETVTEFIRRCGFPYSIHEEWERDDN